MRDREAHRIVSELEWQARAWVAGRLAQASPDDWWETRIPEDPRERADARQREERAATTVTPSDFQIDYLDFSDIREVIRYSPNWKDLFEVVLGDWRAALEEAMRRIEAYRRKVAHSRPITEGELRELEMDARFILELLSR